MSNYILKFNGIEALENTESYNNALTTTKVSENLGIYVQLLNKILVESKVIYKKGKGYIPFEKIPTELYVLRECIGIETYYSLRWTKKGKEYIINNIDLLVKKCGKRTKLLYKKALGV